MTLPAGTRLGAYEILASLGAGGMGESHPAWSPTDPDAILFLRDHKRLAIVSASTGQVRFLPFRMEGSCILDYPSWSRDGKRMYCSVSRKTGDIYLVEGF